MPLEAFFPCVSLGLLQTHKCLTIAQKRSTNGFVFVDGEQLCNGTVVLTEPHPTDRGQSDESIGLSKELVFLDPNNTGKMEMDMEEESSGQTWARKITKISISKIMEWDYNDRLPNIPGPSQVLSCQVWARLQSHRDGLSRLVWPRIHVCREWGST